MTFLDLNHNANVHFLILNYVLDKFIHMRSSSQILKLIVYTHRATHRVCNNIPELVIK